jgi:hypothetical protein
MSPASLGSLLPRCIRCCVARGVDGLRRRVGVTRGSRSVGIGAVAEFRCVLQVGFGHLYQSACRRVGVASGRCCASSGCRATRSRTAQGPSRSGRAGGACSCTASGGRLIGATGGGARHSRIGSIGAALIGVCGCLDLLVRHSLHLIEGNGHILLADAQEATHADEEAVDLAVAVHQDLIDVADLLVSAP